MNPHLRTLSLSAWMSLPGLDFNTWCSKQLLNKQANNAKLNIDDCQTTVGTPNHNHSFNNTHSHGYSESTNWWQCFSTQQQRNCNNNNNINNNNNNRNGIGNGNGNGSCAKCARDTGGTKTKSSNTIKAQILEVKLTNDNTIDTQIIRTPVPRRNLSVRRKVSREVQTRALVSQVADYYENFVNESSLEQYFRNDTLVTSVKPYQCDTNKNIRWLVRGIQTDGIPFAYVCHSVVLANGASDLANHLGVNGENTNEWINHDLPALVSVLENIPDPKRAGKEIV